VRPAADGEIGGEGGDGGAGGSDEPDAGGGAGTSGAGGGEAGTGGGGEDAAAGGSGGSGGSTPVDAAKPPPADMAAPPRPEVGPDLTPDISAPDTTPDVAGPALAMGLVSRWKLDEGTGTTTADATATGNDGTIVGGATWLDTGFPGAHFGNPGALHFDGMNDVVDIGVKGLPAVDQPKSISMWIRYDAVPANTNPIMGLGSSGAGRIKVGFKGGLLAAWKGDGSVLAGAMPPASGWHHFVYTYDGTSHHIFVDAADKGSGTTSGDTGAIAQGHLGTFGTEHFTGDLDEVRIYKRALTVSEIVGLHDGFE
jgi:hypothetical protein